MRIIRRTTRFAALLAVIVTVPVAAPVAGAQAPPAPVFTDGQAQPVFDPADVVRENLWVTAPVDSDRDGAPDKVHVEVVRPKATQQGLRVPVVYQASPYFGGGNDEVPNHDVDVELYAPTRPGRPHAAAATAAADGARAAGASAAEISWRYEEYFLARGFAVVYAESLGSGQSTGCPTAGGENETAGARSVVDWLNNRAEAHDADGNRAGAGWSTGKTGMMGVSYNGTLPNAVAGTGVPGLETIVPIAGISSWYDYYRSNGAVVAPGGYQGEDADVMAEYVHTRADRAPCRPVIDELAARQDRTTGDYSRFWDERNFRNATGNVHASVLAVHGLNDWNVKTDQVATWYAGLRAHGVEHKIWLHQSGHADPYTLRKDVWLGTLNKWMSHYLYGIDNGIEREPKATIQREDQSWTDERDWPADGTDDVRVFPTRGGAGTGGVDLDRPVLGPLVTERFTDDATKTVEQLVDLPDSGNRLAYATGRARAPVRLSGTPKIDLALTIDRPAANLTGVLIDRAPDGTATVITRGWADPQNRVSPWLTLPIKPGQRNFVSVPLQPDDYLLAADHRLEFVIASSDHDFTLRPAPGAGLAVDLNLSSVTIPVQGGKAALHNAF